MYMIALYHTWDRWNNVLYEMLHIQEYADQYGNPADWDELERLEREHDRLSRILGIPDYPY